MKRFVAAYLLTVAMAGAGLIAGCEYDHHDYDRDRVIVVHDTGGWEHHGWYDARGDWHGGWYDERHRYHEDKEDWGRLHDRLYEHREHHDLARR